MTCLSYFIGENYRAWSTKEKRVIAGSVYTFCPSIIYRLHPRAVVKILSERSPACTNFARGPPARLSVAPTHSEKGLLLSPSTGKLRSHRENTIKVPIIYYTMSMYRIIRRALYYDVCTCTRAHVERAPKVAVRKS